MLKQLQFFSVASDGRVTLWTLAKNELLHQVPMLRCINDDMPYEQRLHTSVYTCWCCHVTSSKSEGSERQETLIRISPATAMLSAKVYNAADCRILSVWTFSQVCW